MRLQRAVETHIDDYLDALRVTSAELAKTTQTRFRRLTTRFRDQPEILEFKDGTIAYNFDTGTVEKIAVDPPDYPVLIPVDIYLDSKDEPMSLVSALDTLTEIVSDWVVGTDVEVQRLRRIVDDLRSDMNEVLANPMLSDIEGALKVGSQRQLEALLGMDAEDEPLIDELFSRNYWVRRSVSYVIAVSEPRPMEPPRLLSEADSSYRLRGRYQHQDAYVIGFDDTPDDWFIYPVDGSRISKAMNLTDAGVRRAMGYQFDADESGVRTAVEKAASQQPSEPRPFQEQAKNPATTVRVQGDLFIEVVDQYDSPAAAHAATDGMETLLAAIAEETTLNARQVLDILRRVSIYVDSDDTTANVNVMATQQAYRLVEHATFDSAHTPEPLDDSALGTQLRDLATEAGTTAVSVDSLFGSTKVLSTAGIGRAVRERLQDLWRSVDTANYQTRLTATDEREGQLTLPIDNHLLLLENGWVSPLSYREEEPVTIVVPQETLVTIPHDEHNEKTFNLPAGAYRFYLGVPGVKPFPADRPEWLSTEAGPTLDDHTPNRRY